jgi:uroporphyrinogen decarboxylase
MGIWGQTLDRWLSEGMPMVEKQENLIGALGLLSGSDYFGFDRRDYVDVRLDAQPPYLEVVLEETERHRVFIDEEGSTRRALKMGEAHGMRMSMDTFVDFPAKNREDWVEFKKHFNPKDPVRYPKWWEDKVQVWAERDYPVVLPVNSERAFGLYSWLRRCMGTVNACLVLYDEPAYAEELLDFYTDFTIDTIHRALHEVDIDYFNIFEDMAGKGGPLVSPKLFKKFMVPRYRRLTDFLHSHGVEYVSMDSDGDIRALIPLIMEGGINVLWPIEPAAGMEPLELRKEYGRDLRLWGGIDKRALAKGREDIEHELFRKVPALLEDGGYIPMLDHDVPPDVPYDNYLYYLELKRRIAEGQDGA